MEDNPGETGAIDTKKVRPSTQNTSPIDVEIKNQHQIFQEYIDKVNKEYGELTPGKHSFGINFLKW